MGTRTTLRWHEASDTGPGFHLYSDWLDECAGANVLHLAFEGCDFEASCSCAGATRVTVTMPRPLAETLGVAEPVEAADAAGPFGERPADRPPDDASPADASRRLAGLPAKVLRMSDEARDAASPTEATAKLLWMQRSIQEGRAEALRLVADLLAPVDR